jgi:hypothetical protein
MRKIFMIWVISVGALAWNSTNAFSWDFPLTLYPVGIQFNHSLYYSHSLDIRKNAGDDITVPEYDTSVQRNEEFAYLKGVTPYVLVKLFTTTPDTPSLTIRAYGSDSWNLADREVSFNENNGFSIGDEGNLPGYVIMSSSTSVPNSVGKHDKTWDWYVCKVGGNPIGPFWTGSSSHTYYTVLDTPVSPLTEPWTDVLDYACSFASGQSTTSGVVSKIAEGIYSSLCDQNGGIDYVPLQHFSPANNSFSLSSFLSALSTSSNVEVNCTDVAQIFCIFCASLGILSYDKEIDKAQGEESLDTHSIDPIGSPGSAVQHWSYHQIGWYNSLVDDACIKINSVVPRNQIFSNYINDLLDPDDQGYTTSVYTTSISY